MKKEVGKMWMGGGMGGLTADDGFFLTCEDFLGKFDDSFPAFVFFCFVFLKWRSTRLHQFHFLGQQAEMTVAERP